MAANPRVLELLEAMLDSGKTPEEVCRDCPELLPEVRRRWREFRAIDEQVGALIPGLRTTAGVDASARDFTITDLPQVPGYELSCEVGRGGMGVVYRAHDLALDRDVAVKLLQHRYPADSSIAHRFTDEARITAQLQHPGVPAVYRVGTLTDGRPFLAMKLIKGRTMSALLGERPAPSADRGRFVAIFEHVCQAVAYAHSLRVIHRDLKPSNVMVGKFGEVQVMDWGLAKVLPACGPPRDETPGEKPPTEGTVIRTRRVGVGDTPNGFGSPTPPTLAGSVLGTPAYMSTEQAEGAIDRLNERCDVFGLGAVLCEILTGKPPYTGRDEDQIYRKALTANQADAHARLAACGAEPELVALCLRCLAPEPDDRPHDAGEIAAAVAALRAAAEDRARRAELDRVRAVEQGKRRRAQVALVAAVGLLACGGIGFAWWQEQQETARRAQLTRNADALDDLAGRCERALRDGDADQAAVALGEVERRLAEGGGDTVRDRAARCRADLAVLRELDRADTSRWNWVANKPLDPKVGADLRQTALTGYGVTPGSTPAAEAASRVSGSPVRDRLLIALDLSLVAEPSPGLLEILRAADPDPYRDEVRGAIAASDSIRLKELAGRPEALTQPPHFATVLGQLSAIPAARRRIALAAALRSRPGDLVLLMTLGNSYPIDRPEGAEERVRWYQAAVAAHPRSAAAHTNLGAALLARGDQAGAVASYREAIRLDPEDAPTHYNLGNALYDRNDVAGAVASYREAIRLDPKLMLAHYNLGMTLAEKNDVAGAVACFREAIRLDPTFARAHNNLGIVLAGKKDFEAAAACFREAIRLDSTFARAHNNLGNVLFELRDYDGAVACYREVVRLAPRDLAAHKRLASVLAWRGELQAALEVLQQGAKANPGWVADPAAGVQYESACYACRAAAGSGKDAPPAGDRPALRNQALGWLTAELAAWRTRLTADPLGNRAAIHGAMARWLADPALASVRRQTEVERLPLDERVGWVKLWSGVRDLHDATIPLELAPPPRLRR